MGFSDSLKTTEFFQKMVYNQKEKSSNLVKNWKKSDKLIKNRMKSNAFRKFEKPDGRSTGNGL